jgi:hypothetical protein
MVRDNRCNLTNLSFVNQLTMINLNLGVAMTEWFEVVLEEYKSTRIEITNAIQLQQHIIYVALGAISIMIGFGFTLWDKLILPEFIYMVLIPIISYLFLFNWLGEVARMMRAGNFNFELEDKINNALANEIKAFGKALIWEHWIRENSKNKTKQNKWNYGVVILLFITIPILSNCLGIYHNILSTHNFILFKNPLILYIVFACNFLIWVWVFILTIFKAISFH